MSVEGREDDILRGEPVEQVARGGKMHGVETAEKVLGDKKAGPALVDRNAKERRPIRREGLTGGAPYLIRQIATAPAPGEGAQCLRIGDLGGGDDFSGFDPLLDEIRVDLVQVDLGQAAGIEIE